jgi:1-acyl-sn-glycerol-3-phosphate acyltransferase
MPGRRALGHDEIDLRWQLGIAVVGAIARLLFRLRAIDPDHVPDGGPAILAANHISVLDGPLLCYATAAICGRSIRFLVAAEMLRLPVLGAVLQAYGQIPIRRGERDSDALAATVRAVRAGALVGIFPEGRVTAGDPATLQRVRRGVARIAIASQAPVIPVAIWGTHRRWPRGGPRLRRPLRPVAAIAFGRAIPPPDGRDEGAQVDEYATIVGRAIAVQLERARLSVEAPRRERGAR